MKVPIQNIYYLLCYAWDKLEEREVVDVSLSDETNLADLFAKVLINGTTYLFKRGLDRGYLDVNEDTRSLRGKIRISPSIKRNLFRRSMASCCYDELSYDVLHNRILKASFRTLLRVGDLDKGLKEELAVLYKKFPPISDITLESRHFSQVRLNRNNHFYDFLLQICRIIHESVFVDEAAGEARFMDFIRDEMRMAAVFEEFVRNFYRKELSGFRVGTEYIQWTLAQPSLDDAYLPYMETDTSLTAVDGSRKIVVETKYYKKVLRSRMGARGKINSAHLYQLYAYLKNLEADKGPNSNCKGILLYAAVDEDLDFHYSLPGHDLRVKTLNLCQDWKDIHSELVALVGECA
ncbi:5-methylcytosine-specific restriction enzyme subunit McrC [Desulfatibacillum alkenivorans DSM 16219]|jgi:5-methylcytosine-specific restriction enzyme subunit McrC|uniref:5-methylcytosine-specific restriction enzyme subunit McrC n=1 Tax=Desulfatibacillum alkenivorans DSM 16219 TaxID=1121393 RepID=A0A1M6NW63_9BACT|nr:5-methylcytosine-specific restriction endonuclease system specificity protein McrC [Desulfatibacillum alkenivorans]SHJ99890.1 5-methylcytosine-specific restriction enzyme subunit McrC [Desulfatibacillum alkenivorans DSM 16219]